MLPRERWILALLCFLAALRVFVYAAAFPFFSNGDEDLHFDVIARYAAAELPRNFDVLEPRTVELVALYASPEFLQTPDDFPEHQFPAPLWKQSTEEAAPIIEVTKDAWKREMNWEASQPPLYYALAAVWWKIGNAFGLRGIEGLYWIRFLNAFLMSILVALGFACARLVAPQSANFSIGTALLLAFMPQDVFYVISNDVLSPICFGLVFVCVLLWFSKPPSLALGAFSGLAIAATYLTKLSNVPLLLATIISIVWHTLRSPSQPQRLKSALAFAALALSAAIPIAAWIIWCRVNFGDPTGSSTKIALLGWTVKPFSEWCHHPIFSGSGLWTFWFEIIARFWRGELMWQHVERNLAMADWFYAVSSLIFVAAAIAALRWRAIPLPTLQAKAIACAALAFAGVLAFFFLLSIRFDFDGCLFPSRDHPYFTSGRLMSGALIPFALLYVSGVILLSRVFALRFPAWIVLTLIALVCMASEIAVKLPVFASEHNWFHL